MFKTSINNLYLNNITVKKTIRQYLNLICIPPQNVINQFNVIKEIARYLAHYNSLKVFF